MRVVRGSVHEADKESIGEPEGRKSTGASYVIGEEWTGCRLGSLAGSRIVDRRQAGIASKDQIQQDKHTKGTYT